MIIDKTDNTMKIDICSKDGFFSFRMSQSEKQSESISSQLETEKESSNKAPGEYRHTIYMHGPISYMEYPQLTSKDIYRNYWRCRDSEINNRWQRFLFLTVFMVLCFIFYGVAMKNLVDSLKTDTGSAGDLYRDVVNGISFFLCMIGVVLSYLWMMMAKASKAWCEIHERAISAIEVYGLKGCGEKKDIAYRSLDPTKLDNYLPPVKDDSLFTSHAGAFSIVGINWAIGFMALMIWSLLLAMHAILIGWHLAAIGGFLGAVIIVVSILYTLYKVVRCQTLASKTIKERTTPIDKTCLLPTICPFT